LHAVAVWVNYNGAHKVIKTSNGYNNITLPPSGLSATQSSTNFGVYTDYYNTIAWKASPDPNLIEYIFIAMEYSSLKHFLET
jgi:hypothetical protein